MSGSAGWRELSFAGRSAVVTGAARGIGRAVAHRLAGLGARTVIWDRDGAEAERAAAELADLLREQDRPRELEWLRLDVTDPDAVASAVARTAGEGLDVLVNNAGTTTVQGTEDMPFDEWESVLRVNLDGTFFCCRAAIVNISSSSALVGGGGGAHHAASKAGMDGLTRHLAMELAPGVRVNSIQPRAIETDLFRARYAHAPPSSPRTGPASSPARSS